jgi:hypothetical protein
VLDHHVAQVVSRFLNAEVWVRSHGSSCGICGRRIGTESGFAPNSSVFSLSVIPLVFHDHVY